jgi:hypothetical protein
MYDIVGLMESYSNILVCCCMRTLRPLTNMRK